MRYDHSNKTFTYQGFNALDLKKMDYEKISDALDIYRC